MTNNYINCKIIVLAVVWYMFLKYCTSNKFDETKNYSASEIGDDLSNGEEVNVRV